MNYAQIINSKYAEPASVLLYNDGVVRILDMNGKFISEHWTNTSKEEFMESYVPKSFDENNIRILINAIRRCIDTNEEQEVETWRQMISDCCGYDRVCLKSRIVLIENTDDGAILYEGIHNITNEKQIKETLDDIEYRYKQASEQINIYNWEYDVATKEMRPCYRCMRDLGLPALVTNYPEPAILAMTANAFASDVQDCLDAGMNAHIPKPFRKEDLITRISENLRGNSISI